MPGSQDKTLRTRIREALRGGMSSLRDLSQLVGVSEKDLPHHLEHIRRSARRDGERWLVESATCQKCGFSFDDRRRFTSPSRCPECRSERITSARYGLA